jgi:hypothetical protein
MDKVMLEPMVVADHLMLVAVVVQEVQHLHDLEDLGLVIV